MPEPALAPKSSAARSYKNVMQRGNAAGHWEERTTVYIVSGGFIGPTIFPGVEAYQSSSRL
jgi:hypothetical protein